MVQVDRVVFFLGFIFGIFFLGFVFEVIFVLEFVSQVYFFYRWVNCISLDNILVNMDECFLVVYVEGCRGIVLRFVRGVVRVFLSIQRFRMTFLVLVFIDFGFNVILSQVIIVNKIQFFIKFMKFLDSVITDRLKIWRGVIVWNIVVFMCFYLRFLYERW